MVSNRRQDLHLYALLRNFNLAGNGKPEGKAGGGRDQSCALFGNISAAIWKVVSNGKRLGVGRLVRM